MIAQQKRAAHGGPHLLYVQIFAFARHHIDDALADVGRMIADPFEMIRYEQ